MTAVVDSRRCAICGESIDGRRAHARYCGGPCRAEASRLNRLLRGERVDGYASVSERLAVARKRTQRREFPYDGGQAK